MARNLLKRNFEIPGKHFSSRFLVQCKYSLLIIFTIGFLYSPATGQKPGELDSLLQLLNAPAASDSLRADIFRQLANYYIHFSDNDQALVYLDSLRDFSQRKDYQLGELFYHYTKAYYYFRRGIYDSVEVHTQRVLELSNAVKKPGWKVDAQNKLAIIHGIRGQYDSAFYYLQDALTLSKQLDDLDLITMNLQALGNLELDQGNYLTAIQYFLKVDSIYIGSSEDNDYRHGLILQNIGSIYRDQIKDYPKALQYLRKAEAYYIKENYDRGEIDDIHSEIGRVYSEMREYDKADSLLSAALNGFRSRGHQRQVAETALFLSKLKMELKQFEFAEALLSESLIIYKKIGEVTGESNVYDQFGDLKMQTGDYQLGIDFWLESLILEKSGYNRAEILKKLAGAYHIIGDNAKAYETILNYVTVSDSLNAYQLSGQLQEIETKYQASQKEKEIVDLKLQQTQKDIRSQQILYGGFVTLVILGGISLLFYYRAKHRKKMNQHLHDLDELKSKLFTDISHEFRTPLTLITGPVQMLLKEQKTDAQAIKELQVVHRNAERLNQLVDNINDLAKLEVGKMKLSIRPVNLNDHLKVVVASYESMAEVKGIKFKVNIDVPDLQYYYDPLHFETIAFNLLSNAFKYTEQGMVSVTAKIDGGVAILEVSDTGPGFSLEHQDKIFQRYYRVDSNGSSIAGSGIGLALASELASLHKGSLTALSKLGEGSTFTLIIPVKKETYEKSGLLIGPTYTPIEQKKVDLLENVEPKLPGIHEDEPLILLVEDNADMRHYLDRIFQDDYRIITAQNGKEGFELADQYIPDIVISDLMMPVMDGHSFFKKIRSNEKTSHIPFIMLTANHLEEDKLKNLRAGVDDFITKPFSIDEIGLKVQNILKMQEQLREKYGKEGMVNPEYLTAHEADKQFWSRLHRVVRANLDNPDFSATDFATKMHLSRMQLHRKLKAMTNLSASAFLRSQRLTIAAHLISKGYESISDVAYSVGFSSPFYFAKCFKRQFNLTPSEYGQQHNRPVSGD